MWRSDRPDVRRRRALLALHDVELHALSLGEALEPRHADRRVMDEHVLRAVVRRDEPETLRIVEPLHLAFNHRPLLRVLHERQRSTGTIALPAEPCMTNILLTPDIPCVTSWSTFWKLRRGVLQAC